MSIERVILHDPQSSATAKIAPGIGFNCYDFTVLRHDHPIRILWTAHDFEAGVANPMGSGIPSYFRFRGESKARRSPGTDVSTGCQKEMAAETPFMVSC